MRRAAEAGGVLLVAALAVAASLASCSQAALAQAQMARQVVGAGGTGMSSPSYSITGTVVQTAVGAGLGATSALSHGFWARGGAAVLEVDDPPGPGPQARPGALSLGPATPNPVRSSTRFRLALPEPARIRFGLFDLQGRPVGGLVDRELPAGWHDLAWAAPRGVAGLAGVFFASLEVDGRRVATQRVVVTP